MFFMMFAVSIICLILGYIFYGRFMAKVYNLDNHNVTPAERLNDGMDYCPTHPAVVLGHHFSSIAGAGPIVGPITAASMFGWLPTIVWCIFGSIFLGGPHDFGAVMASMRHDGKSIGEVIDHWIGPKAKKLFLIFTILSLFLVVAVFTVLTTATFVLDPVVAFVSCMYIVLAVVSGLLIYRFNMNLKLVTIVMLAIIAFCSIKGGDWPIVAKIFTHSSDWWNFFIAIYILCASVLPVWLLLQPRDYLASYFLYFAAAIGAIGMIFGGSMDSGAVPMFAPEMNWFGLTKADIRRIGAAIGLPAPDQAARPCLLTRFPYGVSPSREALDTVARVEAFLETLPEAKGERYRLRYPSGRPELHWEASATLTPERLEVVDKILRARFPKELEELTMRTFETLSGYYDRPNP